MKKISPSCDALVVGAGPAGLATSRELSRRGVSHVVLERGDQVGQTWAHLYDSLVLHTAKRLSALPGVAFPPGTPLFRRAWTFSLIFIDTPRYSGFLSRHRAK